MTYGLTSAGFTRKRQPVIEDEIKAAYEAAFSIPAAAMTGETVLGELAGIHAEREALIWELIEAVHHAQYPDTAEGTSLAYAAALTGHAPLPAQYSTVTVTCGTDGASPVTLLAGRQVKVLSTGATFETIEDAEIPASSTVDVACRAVVTGPLEAPAGTLTTIVTPVSGWDTATNASDAVVGRDAEKDTEFRARRARELQIALGGPIAAMEARIPEMVDGVTFCAVAENRTDTTDGDGVPPHSIHVFVIGGVAADIAQAIWETKPGGANTYGGESAVIVDSLGNNQTIYWDEGSELRIYLVVNLTVTGDYPADGDDLVKAALSAHDDDMANGDDVINWQLVAALAGIPGITAVTIYQGTSPAPVSSANTSVAANQKASIAEADITVNR